MARILYAEDYQAKREALTEMLTEFGHEVVSTSNPAEALKAFHEQGTFDLVLTDYEMGIQSGVDLARGIREKNKHIPIIMLSNDLLEDIAPEYPDYDGLNIEYVHKSTKDNILNEKITSQVHRYKTLGMTAAQGTTN